MIDAPTFTVVMAAYNRGWHILPSIESVLQQSLQDFHLLVVGDGCEDDTGEAVASLGSPRVTWANLTHRSGSQSGPNNWGIERANGRYVAYIGHDDVWCPDHLEALNSVFLQPVRPDFAVSGTIFHMPRGVDSLQVTGIFDDDAAKFTHFFPPSGLAHHRAALRTIGGWKPPGEVRAPVDADMLLRAAHAGLTFASSGRVTVHKFAAGHRYLSYLSPSSEEQEEMLRRAQEPGHADWLRNQVERARRQGTFMIVKYTDFGSREPGQLAAQNASAKGLRGADVLKLERRAPIPQPPGPLGVDWHARSTDGLRWADLNPSPRLLIPFTAREAEARVQILIAHSSPDELVSLAVRNGETLLPVHIAAALPVSDHWEAVASFDVPLASDRPTILQVDLKGGQLARGGRRGIGIGEMVIDPHRVLGPDVVADSLCAGLLLRASATPVAKGVHVEELQRNPTATRAGPAVRIGVTSWRLTRPLRGTLERLRRLGRR